MKKRAFAIFIIFVLSLMYTTNVSASDNQTRASQYLSSYSASLATEEEGIISISFLVFATSVADKVGASKIVIQQKSSSSWSNVQTYDSDNMNDLLGYNCLFKDGKVTYSGVSGYQYRAIVTIYAEIGSGSDSRIVTTNTVIP